MATDQFSCPDLYKAMAQSNCSKMCKTSSVTSDVYMLWAATLEPNKLYRLVNCAHRDLDLQEAEGVASLEPEIMLNYQEYYPTLLPLRQPGMEETDTEAHARNDRPPDLSIPKVSIAANHISTMVNYICGV